MIESLLDKLDKFIIHEKDVEILDKLVSSLDDELFLKIMEEILDGYLFISDFNEIFSSSEYSEMLEKRTISQEKLEKHLTRLVEFRNYLGHDLTTDLDTIVGIPSPGEYNIESEEILLALLKKYNSNDKLDDKEISQLKDMLRIRYKKDIYTAMSNIQREDILTEMLDYSPMNEIERAYRLKILASIMDISFVSNEEYVDPNKIYVQLNNFIIPILEEDMTFGKWDLDFMEEHSLTEDEVKKIKALSSLLMKENIFDNVDLDWYMEVLTEYNYAMITNKIEELEKGK